MVTAGQTGAIRLAARFLSGGPGIYVLTDRRNSLNQAIAYILPDTGFQEDEYLAVPFTKRAPRFPYGFAVEGDHV